MKCLADNNASTQFAAGGSSFDFSSDCLLCPEALFKPSLIEQADEGINGIAEMISLTIKRCDTEIREVLSASIVLAGGNTMFPGLVPRLVKELDILLDHTVDVKASEDRMYSAWTGGSSLACESSFENCWITIHDYDKP